MTEPLILKRASASRSSGKWSDDHYDVLAGGVVVGCIFRAAASPEGSPWIWTLAFGHHEDRTPTQGYEPTREAAMATGGQFNCSATLAVVFLTQIKIFAAVFSVIAKCC